MAKAAEKRSRIESLSLGEADRVESVDLAIKSLIDELIVPYLVEEFLRLHGPAAVAKQLDGLLVPDGQRFIYIDEALGSNQVVIPDCLLPGFPVIQACLPESVSGTL